MSHSAASSSTLSQQAATTQPASLSERMHQILRSLPSALCLVSESGSVLHLNQRALDTLQLSETIASLQDFPRHLQDFAALFSQPMEADSVRQELSVTFPNEEEPRTLGYTLRLEAMEGLGNVRTLVFSDITQVLKDRKQSELLKSDLNQAKKMAAMGNLIAGVSHELNNPLIAIYMSADLSRMAIERVRQQLDKTPEDALNELPGTLEASLDEINRILGAATQASALVKDLLNYARPTRLDTQLVNLYEWLEGQIPTWLQSGSLTSNAPKVTIQESTFSTWCNIDPIRLEPLFHQLLQNASEASQTPDKPVQISIHFQQIPDAKKPKKRLLEIHVADNGKGMSQDIQERIFEPFFTTKGMQGTGLGLSQAYRTAEQHKGSLSVKSTLGVGTTFVLTIPLDSDMLGATH